MKRYAVLDRNLTFNNAEDWFNKNICKFVEQKPSEEATVKAFEKKYGIELEWREMKDGDISFKGYFPKTRAGGVR